MASQLQSLALPSKPVSPQASE